MFWLLQIKKNKNKNKTSQSSIELKFLIKAIKVYIYANPKNAKLFTKRPTCQRRVDQQSIINPITDMMFNTKRLFYVFKVDVNANEQLNARASVGVWLGPTRGRSEYFSN